MKKILKWPPCFSPLLHNYKYFTEYFKAVKANFQPYDKIVHLLHLGDKCAMILLFWDKAVYFDLHTPEYFHYNQHHDL